MTSPGVPEPRKPIKWVPLAGEFVPADRDILFRGRPIVDSEPPGAAGEKKVRPGWGMALSDRTLADGMVSADVRFREVTTDTTCEIIVAYDPNAEHILAAGLGSQAWAMFGIREFGSQRLGRDWLVYRAGGDRANLIAGQVYHIDVHFLGASVTLHVDGVNVGAVEATSPSGRVRHVGILCRGTHETDVSSFTVYADKPRAFVVMQFGSEFDDVYQDVVKEVCKDFEVNVLRADEVSGPGLIVADIVREIGTSQLIIADITPTNANVYFEVGYALALAKPTILLARKGTPLPFDIAGFRVLFYEDTIGGKRRLEEGLRRHLDAILTS
jgi:hypothetical protein